MLDGAIAAREEAASKLIAGVGWFWIVYTGVALTGVVLTDTPIPTSTVVFLVMPIAILVFAYLAALWAIVPVDANVDPTRSDLIEAAYVAALTTKKHRLRIAFTLSAAGALAVVVAGIAAADSSAPFRPTFDTVTTHTGVLIKIRVAGEVNAETDIVVTAVDPNDPGQVLGTRVIRSDSDGEFDGVLPIERGPDEVLISAEWLSEETAYSASQEVAL